MTYTNDFAITKIFYEYDMDRMLHFYFGVHIERSEATPSEAHFADLIRCIINREPGDLGMGGKKYIAFYIDAEELLRYDPATLVNRIRDRMLLGIRAAYWTDYLMRMWGYPR